jgi:hypothetical protein
MCQSYTPAQPQTALSHRARMGQQRRIATRRSLRTTAGTAKPPTSSRPFVVAKLCRLGKAAMDMLGHLGGMAARHSDGAFT